MAFIKLKNLKGETIRIPASAAKSYENLGFYPEKQIEEAVEETTEDVDMDLDEQEPEQKPDSPVNEDEDKSFADAIRKKPLASWNKDEVRRFASIFDIDLTGTKSANEAKERIKAFMNNEE